MLPLASNYDDLYARFRWRLPARYNIGVDVCDRHANGDGAPALIIAEADGRSSTYSFDDIRKLSNRLANVLTAEGGVSGAGLARGDRVGILLGQGLEAAVSHIAIYKAGLVALPLFTLFGPEALEYRLKDSGARLLITTVEGALKVMPLRESLPDLEAILVIDGAIGGTLDFHDLMDAARDSYAPVDTAADDPALIIYTSGTTGNPKGALHAHRTLLGHLPGVELPHDYFPKPGDRFWTPADWAWIGGLLDVLLPAWHHGVSVVAHRARKFDPDEALALMAKHGVRNVFIPPTALKLMRQGWNDKKSAPSLRSLGSGGETLGEEMIAWGRKAFGLTIHEFYGQTECNLVVGNNSHLFPVRPGSMGKAIPGHRVSILTDEGQEAAPGEEGDIAVHRFHNGTADPVFFLGYWNQPKATAEKFRGDWLITGDRGMRDKEGYFHFVGRADDIITSGGYRIGPGEVEDCLLRHPAIAMAAVVGEPDPVRTELVKAVLVLKEGYVPSDTLTQEIQQFVKARLAAHEYPRIVEYRPSLPMTTTGKILRRLLRS